MSFDLYFLDARFTDDWHGGMEALEASTLQSPAWDTADDAQWAAILEALDGIVAEIDSEPGSRRACHEGSGITLIAHPAQLSIDIPFSAGPAQPLTDLLCSLAATIETATGLVAFNPQSDSGFLEWDDNGIAWVTSRSQGSIERLITHPNDLWRSRASMLALTKDELKQLRSTKGDRARRARAACLLLELPAARALRMGEDWHWINHLCARPFEGLRIFVGQRMHRGQSNEVTLLKDLPAQVAFMDGLDAEQIYDLVLAKTDEDIHYRTQYHVRDDWEAAGISDIATPARAKSAGELWERLRRFLRTAMDEGTAPLFVTDHMRSGRKHMPGG